MSTTISVQKTRAHTSRAIMRFSSILIATPAGDFYVIPAWTCGRHPELPESHSALGEGRTAYLLTRPVERVHANLFEHVMLCCSLPFSLAIDFRIHAAV